MDTELTNMVMITHPETGEVLVQNRLKSWKGYSFPGGHVEPGESFYDSAVREVREETGLTVRNLKCCGTIHWCQTETSERYLVFLYKTSEFSGELIPKTEEGEVFWMPPDKLRQMDLTGNSFSDYFPIFFGEGFMEGFCPWNEQDPGVMCYL